MAAPPIAGVLETAIYVADLPGARTFYEDVLGLSPMFTDARLAAYAVGRSVLLVFLRHGATETVTLPGGDLVIEWRADDHVLLTGPAEHEFAGSFDPATGAWMRQEEMA